MVHVFLLCSCSPSLLFPSVVVVSSVFFWLECLIYLWQFSLLQSFSCSCKFSTSQRNTLFFNMLWTFWGELVQEMSVLSVHSSCSFYAVSFTLAVVPAVPQRSAVIWWTAEALHLWGGTVVELRRSGLTSWFHIWFGFRPWSFEGLISPLEMFSLLYCLTCLFSTEV